MSKDYDVAVRWHIGSAAPKTTTVHVEATTTAAALRLARRGIYLDHPGAAIDKTEIVYLEKPETEPITIGSAESRTITQQAIKRSQQPAITVTPEATAGEEAPEGAGPLSETEALGIMRRRREAKTATIEAVPCKPDPTLTQADVDAAASDALADKLAQPEPVERDCLRHVTAVADPHATAVAAAQISAALISRGLSVAATAPEPVADGDCPTDRASALVAEIAKRYGQTAVGAFLDAMDEFIGSRRANAWTGSRLWITVAKVPELKRKAA